MSSRRHGNPERPSVWIVLSGFSRTDDVEIEGVHATAEAADQWMGEHAAVWPEYSDYYWLEEHPVLPPDAGVEAPPTPRADLQQARAQPEAVRKQLVEAIRVERSVSVAVLIGPLAWPEVQARPDAEVLLLVSLREKPAGSLKRLDLARRVSSKLGRDVRVVRLAGLEDWHAALVVRALDDGVLITDRDGVWAALRERRAEIVVKAEQQDLESRRRVREFLHDLGVDPPGEAGDEPY